MKYSIIESASSQQRKIERTLDEEGGGWVRLGNTLFVFSANNTWGGIARKMGHGRLSTGGKVKKRDLHLVIQKGRIFQKENPDVPVLLDKGRYLIVEISKSEARQITKSQGPCFHFEPLHKNSIAFEIREPGKASSKRTELVDDLVSELDQSTFEHSLNQFVSYPTRYSTSNEYRQAAEWARDTLSQFGFETSEMTISVDGGSSLNIIASKQGTSPNAGVILVTAHLDSINHADGPLSPAPGADDNASGSAGLITLAQAVSTHSFKHDIKFILFGGEEQGLLGSTQFVDRLDAAERARVLSVLNMDMIGSLNAMPQSVLLESNSSNQSLIDALAEAAATYSDLEVQVSLKPFGSDHMPFLDANIPAILTIEGADNANDAIHSAQDTADRVNPQYALEILKMNAGWLGEAAGVDKPLTSVNCGCEWDGDSREATNELRVLGSHYQALFAQYRRVANAGSLSPEDISDWQRARHAFDQLFQDKEGAIPK